MTVEARLKPPVNSKKLDLLSEGRVEEIQVEDRPDYVPLDPGKLKAVLIDYALFQQRLRLFAVLIVICRCEETSLQGLDGVGKFHHDQLVDIIRLDSLRIW